jgi:DEAD/DEAH box helicase domain-containing protein
MASATIANPCELAQQLTNREILEVSQDGAPRGRKQFFIFNPPLLIRNWG